MRLLILVGAAALLLLPAMGSAKACGAGHSAQAATADYSAATKKKIMKRVAKRKAPTVEYMRAAPM